jgi:hypothetical protein
VGHAVNLSSRVLGYVVAAAIALGLLGVIQHYRNAAAKERLLRLNAEAAADTTQHFLRGQLQIATRLMAQRPLGGGRVVTVTLEVPGDTVHRVDTLLVRDTLRAQLDTNGVHVGAVVALVPPAATWWWTLTRDPVRYTATVTCADGAARLSVAGPSYQALQLTNLTQAPGICNPPPRWQPFAFKVPSLPVAAGLVGLGYLLGR